MMPRTVAIIGLGLIGGSLGLALRRRQIDMTDPPAVVGWDVDPAVGERALARGAVDRVSADPGSAAAEADVVVVAVPVLAVREMFAAIARSVRSGAVVTDVASTKVVVCGWAAEMLPGLFIGGHPMAGSERGGVEHARADLFTGATYCLTPEPQTPPAAIEAATSLVLATGARPLLLTPTVHDRAVAAVSHLPFLLSRALVEVAGTDPEWELLQQIAASGFRDVTRLASADPRMHRDICLTNAGPIRARLIETARMLEALAQELDDGEALLRRFETSKVIRDALVQREKPRP